MIPDAANDVHSSLTVYQRLSEIAQKRGVVLKDFAAEYASNVDFSYPKEMSSPISYSSSQATSTVTESSQTTDVNTEGDEHDTTDRMVTMRPQYLRAYRYWHERGMSLEKMRNDLSLTGEGLKDSTVMFVASLASVPWKESNLSLNSSYVIGALQADSTLPFSMRKLRALVQMDGPSWVRHREWILSAWAEGKGM